MEQIQFISTSPEALANLISEAINLELQELRINLSAQKEPEYLSRKEVADLLHCSIGSVHNLTIKKVLTKYQIGGKVLYRKEEVLKAIIKLK